MDFVLLAILAQTQPYVVVEDVNCFYPSINCLRAFGWTHGDAFEQEQRHTQHLQWLNRVEKSGMVSPSIIQIWRRETEDRLACWANLLGATDPGRSLSVRRVILDRLRDLLGEERFYRGIMPAPFPLMEYPEVYIGSMGN